MKRPPPRPLSQARAELLLDNPNFIQTSADLIRTEQFTNLIDVAVKDYINQHLGAKTEYEFNYNKTVNAAVQDFRSHITSMIFDRLESVDGEDEEELGVHYTEDETQNQNNK